MNSSPEKILEISRQIKISRSPSTRETVSKSSRATDPGSVYAVLVRVGGARVEARVVDSSVGEDPVDGVSGETRRVPGRGGGGIQLTIARQQPPKG